MLVGGGGDAHDDGGDHGDDHGDYDDDFDDKSDQISAWCCIPTPSPCISVLAPVQSFHSFDQDDNYHGNRNEHKLVMKIIIIL